MQSRNRVTDVENKLTVRNGGSEGWVELGIGIDIYTLLYIKQTANEYLLYSTGNSSQCSVVT